MQRITRAAVLGSGVMGSGIACHLANIGLEVLMLDILPQAPEGEDVPQTRRDDIARKALSAAIKQKPSPLYLKAFAERIEVGNFTDDFARISDCDWIIEVVVERIDIKREILAQVDNHRRPGAIVSSNTSGIPIHMMLEGRSDDFCAHFMGTHFFNPPRYLKLLEIIPSPKTDPDAIAYMRKFCAKNLGKETVLCKDTPAFIANRIGVYAMSLIFQVAGELNMAINDVDKLTGPVIGRPKTGTFRLGDLVGLDVAAKVIGGIRANCPDDAQVQQLSTPAFFQHLLDNHWYGNKSGQGFYKRTEEKDDDGKRVILSLNLDTLKYERPTKTDLTSLRTAKQIEDLPRRLQTLLKSGDAGGELLRKTFGGLFAYASHRVPEISDNIYNIDKALRAGFGWDLGPFEYWDSVGLQEGISLAAEAGYEVAKWVRDMANGGHDAFYTSTDGLRQCYDPGSGVYITIPGTESIVDLDVLRSREPIFKNAEVIVHDIGDQVLCLEFTSKMNTIGEGILRGIQEAITIAESGDWRGLVIGNQAPHFSVGANLMLLAMFAFEEEWEDLALAVQLFQQTSMQCRYSEIPVVAATQGYVFGGSCEIAMHCDAVVSAAESYIGLVETGVGLIPGGGGTKEFALRASDHFFEGDVQIPTLIEQFKTIAMSTVSASAHEAFEFGYLLESRDDIVLRQKSNITEAKAGVIRLSDGYLPPIERRDIQVLGRQGLGALYAAANELYRGHYATEHDIKIARKIAWVLCGGDLSAPQEVTEQYLLDLEREAFLSLMGEPKTIERIQHMLQYRKPLRN